MRPVTWQGGNFHWFFQRIQRNSSSLIGFATIILLIANIYEIMRKLYYILFVVIISGSIKMSTSHHSQVLATFFILKTFPYLIVLHNLTDMRKWYIYFFFFSITQPSAIKHCEMPSVLFTFTYLDF